MKKSPSSRPHTPIMIEEVLKGFEGLQIKVFFEGTLGAGGHARAILEAHPEIERYIGCDKDPEALEIARAHLEPWKDKLELIHGDFADLDRHVKGESVDGFFLT
ncbi:MAG: 16S rRNA (cytosine(1402)-N(4))-methyltransferase [Simkaniaceae bacterium]|nr:16S rRNA (cytosine(1402)-N(4))-methyltransferase [Candidatus Sacchlamyda saccharinae]